MKILSIERGYNRAAIHFELNGEKKEFIFPIDQNTENALTELQEVLDRYKDTDFCKLQSGSTDESQDKTRETLVLDEAEELNVGTDKMHVEEENTKRFELTRDKKNGRKKKNPDKQTEDGK